jgi:hypothetical protein
VERFSGAILRQLQNVGGHGNDVVDLNSRRGLRRADRWYQHKSQATAIAFRTPPLCAALANCLNALEVARGETLVTFSPQSTLPSSTAERRP